MGRHGTRTGVKSSQREVQLAAAVAREAVLQLHADHALALIRHASGRVPELRMLEIYMRLLELSGPAAEAVANRVLATLGHVRNRTRLLDSDSSGDDAADDATLFRMLRRRLRGRVHDALRREVELSAGVAKTALLRTHVAHARGFVRLLAGSHGVAEACACYTDHVEMPKPLASVLCMLVLDRIAAEERQPARPAPPQAAPLRAPRTDARLRRHLAGDSR
jgi:hypothetical protein